MSIFRPNKRIHLWKLSLFALFFSSPPILCRKPHHIIFRSTDLYPPSLAWDPTTEYFLAGSLRSRSIISISDAGVVETLISDPSLPPNATILGLTVEATRRRVVAVVRTLPPLPHFNALAAYDLRSRRRIFLSHLPSDGESSSPPAANDVVLDFSGNAYVTGNVLWKVTVDGEVSVLSPAPPLPGSTSPELNGIVFVGKGYLLVLQSESGRLFKVNLEDGTARSVPLNADLTSARSIALRRDVGAVAVSPHTAWYLTSDDSWGQGMVYDEIALDGERSCTAVAVGGDGRVYGLYGHVEEGIVGNLGRDYFRIEEIRSVREGSEENVWVYVLLGLGLAYFMFWRFQMGRLVKTINKKTM